MVEPDVVIPSGASSTHEFGDALAAWGDELLVGAPSRDYASGDEGLPPPRAYLYRRTAMHWALAQVLIASDPPLSEGFACAVALGRSFAVVGSAGYENGDGPTHDFERSAGDFRLRAEIDSPERANYDDVFSEYGVAIAADDHHAVIGAPLESECSGAPSSFDGGGVVYIFSRDSASTKPIATLRGARAKDNFGSALALSGDYLIVGAPGTESNAKRAGAAYVYRREARDQWREIFRVEGEHAGEELGARVAIDGTRFAVASPGRADLGTPAGSGRVDLFERRGETYTKIATVREQPGFGLALALRGDRVAVGDPMFPMTGDPAQTGRVGLYRVSPEGTLARESWLVIASARPYTRLGSAVALGPDYVAAGAPGMSDDRDAFVAIKSW